MLAFRWNSTLLHRQSTSGIRKCNFTVYILAAKAQLRLNYSSKNLNDALATCPVCTGSLPVAAGPPVVVALTFQSKIHALYLKSFLLSYLILTNNIVTAGKAVDFCQTPVSFQKLKKRKN